MKSPIDLTLIGSDEDSRPRSSKRAKKGDNRTMRPSCGSVISIGSDSEIKEPRRRRRTARKSSLDVIEDKSDDEPMAAGPLPSLPRPHPTVSNTTSIALKSLLMGTSHGHASSIQIAASKDGIRKGEVDPCKDRGRQKGRTCVLPNASGDEGFSLIDEVDQVIREDNHHGKSGRRRSSRLQALPPRPSRIDQNGEDLGVYHFSPNRDEVEGHDKSFMIGSEESGSGVKRKKPSRSGLSSPFSFSNIDCANKEDDSLLPSPTAAPAAKAKRGQRKTEEEKQAEAEVKSRMREEKKKAKEKEREEKKKAAEAEKIEKKAMALTQKALRGRDGEARIRVKFSTKAAVCNWYGAALSSINTILSLPSTATSVCEIPLHPPLALGSELSIVTWSRMMPQAAAQVLMARGGSGGGAKEGEGRQGGSGGVNGVKNVAEIEVMVPLVLVVMTPEDLVAQVEKDKLEGIMERMASHYPECSLLLACCGLDPYLAKKQAKTLGFNIKLIEELILDLVVAPSCSALQWVLFHLTPLYHPL